MALEGACIAALPGQVNSAGVFISKDAIARCGPLAQTPPYPELRISANVHRDAKLVVRTGCSLACIGQTPPILTLQSRNGMQRVTISDRVKIAQGAYIDIRVEPKSHLNVASCFDQRSTDACAFPCGITSLTIDGRNVMYGATSAGGRTNYPHFVQTCYQLNDVWDTVLVTPVLSNPGDLVNVNYPTGYCLVNSGDITRLAADGAWEDGEVARSGFADFTIAADGTNPQRNLAYMPVGAEIFSIVPAYMLGVAAFDDTVWNLPDTVSTLDRTATPPCNGIAPNLPP